MRRIFSGIKRAIDETNRRRKIQEEYNKEHGITPKTIVKEIRDVITNSEEKIVDKNKKKMTKKEKEGIIDNIEQEMKEAAKMLDFERATELRNILFELKGEN